MPDTQTPATPPAWSESLASEKTNLLTVAAALLWAGLDMLKTSVFAEPVNTWGIVVGLCLVFMGWQTYAYRERKKRV